MAVGSQRNAVMIRHLIATLALSLAACGPVVAAEPEVQDKAEAQDKAKPSQPTRMGAEKEKRVYVQLIVKACRQAETPLQPTNQGKSYDKQKPMTGEERRASLAALGCIDVPVPMEFLADAMSPNACIGHAGYMAAMQFLEQRQDLAKFPAVGAWQCVVTDHEVIGATTM